MKIKKLYKKARALGKSIVYPEAAFSDRTIEAIKYVHKKKIAKPILIGDESALAIRDKALINEQIINPKTFQKTNEFAHALYIKRKDKGMTLEEAEKLILDPYYFATMLVQEGYADGMVAGAECSTANAIRPALQIIKAKKKNGRVSSCFLIHGDNKFLKDKQILLADCGLIIDPSADELVEIAKSSVLTYEALGLQNPKVAFLSYSTHGSASGQSVEKVRTATAKFKKLEIPCDGELQLDAALVPTVAKHKCPDSPLEGDANILIMPNLDTGNIVSKAIQYFGGLKATGPILQGLKKPINDLSRGCTAEDIITMTAITVLQCEEDK